MHEFPLFPATFLLLGKADGNNRVSNILFHFPEGGRLHFPEGGRLREHCLATL